MKRKVKFDAAKNNNKTPTESLPDTEFAAQYAGEEDMIRGANRNSKKGRQGGGDGERA
ncbi:stage 0 sporulation regulatory protein [Geobacillus stearothermophilus]|nr:stage 0 sporulation regulatory protein [Geobacillus stearothermophilus]KFX36623.1 stage 0 sporulation regulatory protein [Geobacillus stearothermophilus]